MTIGLFFGGRSVEHGVSIVTAKQVYDVLASGDHDIACIYMTERGEWLLGQQIMDLKNIPGLPLGSSAFAAKFRGHSKPCSIGIDSHGLTLVREGLLPTSRKRIRIDVALPVTHGTHGEDGTLQGLFELFNTPFVGSGVSASAIAMDKALTKDVLRSHGLPVLDDVRVERQHWSKCRDDVVHHVTDRFPYPLFVKPNNLGSSIAVTRAANEEELGFAVDVAFHFSSNVLVEPAVKNVKEVNCAVIASCPPRVSVCENPLPTTELLSYEDKYLHGSKERGMAGTARQLPANLPDDLTTKIQALAIEAFEAIRASGTARVDFLLSEDTKLYVNEVNTIPGSLAVYLWEASGLSSIELIGELIEIAHRTHQEKDRSAFSLNQF